MGRGVSIAGRVTWECDKLSDLFQPPALSSPLAGQGTPHPVAFGGNGDPSDAGRVVKDIEQSSSR